MGCSLNQICGKPLSLCPLKPGSKENKNAATTTLSKSKTYLYRKRLRDGRSPIEIPTSLAPTPLLTDPHSIFASPDVLEGGSRVKVESITK